MVAIGSQILTPPIQRLDWESSHFGIAAAMISEPTLSDDALAAVLSQARGESVQLLVWPAVGGRIVPQELLDQFSGLLADRKATFRRSLQAESSVSNPLQENEPAIVPLDATSASAALYDLAIAAGAYSRFAIDSRFQRERFEAMYRIWMDRSVVRELADAVLVAKLDGGGERLGGMITLSEVGGVASIGLVAVAAGMRGRGIGSALMCAAHRWICARNASEARVVTQLANAPACRLYERAGYTLSNVQHYYHFWL